MKLPILIGLLALALTAHGDYTFTGTSGNITVGPVGGAPFTATASGVTEPVTGLSVYLNMSGGYNGDLYAYLVAPNQTTTATLLGVPGGDQDFNYNGSGYALTLSDLAAVNIQDTGLIQTPGQVFSGTGTYQPEVALFNTFNSYMAAHGANGSWRLFIADQTSGDGGTPVLNGWSLTMTTAAVPEPDQVAAISLLALIGLVAGSYRRWSRALGLQRTS